MKKYSFKQIISYILYLLLLLILIRHILIEVMAYILVIDYISLKITNELGIQLVKFIYTYIPYEGVFVLYLYNYIWMFINKIYLFFFFNYFFIKTYIIHLYIIMCIKLSFFKMYLILMFFSFFEYQNIFIKFYKIIIYFFCYIYLYIKINLVFIFFTITGYENIFLLIFRILLYKFYFIYVSFFKFKTMYFGFSMIIFIPFLCFIVLFFFGYYLGIYGTIIFLVVNYVYIIYILLSCYCYFLINNGILIFNSKFMYINFNFFDIQWSLILDSVNLIMCFVVIIISFLVHLYSVSYMRYDSQLLRFLSFLSLFTFCMLILVNSTNLIHLFFGWEGVGLCSYLLINFWFTRIQANKAAIKAMLMNRIGDISLLIFIAYIYYIYRTFDYSLILMLNASYKYAYINFYYISIHLNSLLVFFLFIAVMGKSAQLGLHTWLPDAMEGPTPVSALIHAATMVTAGVFILIKYYFFLEYSLLHFCIFIIGSLTALFGAIIAIFQNDIKKIIAYSTCSQLGYMIVSCGLGFYNLALFHLFNHAFFKALLFLSAGVILHALSDEQDMRKMGGLVNFLPFTYCCFFFASYALMGLPFLSGFYSKDIILEVSFYSFNIYSLLSFYFLLITAFCTAFYSIKLIYFVFFKKPKGFFISYKVIKDADIIIIFVFLILFFISLFSGFIFFDFFMGLDKEFLLFNVISKTYNNFIEYEFNFYLYKLFPFIFSVLGIICGLYFYYFINNKFTINILNINIYKNIYDFFVNKWFFDLLYNRFFIDNIFKFSYNVTYKLIDKNLLEIFGVNLIYYFVYKISFFFKNYFSTYLYIYLFLFFNGFIILIFLIFQPLYLYIFIFIYIYLICYYLFYLK